MNPDFLLPIVATFGWLIVAGSALVSYRLQWSQMLKMALLWIAIFGGIFLIIEWFMVTRNAASGFL